MKKAFEWRAFLVLAGLSAATLGAADAVAIWSQTNLAGDVVVHTSASAQSQQARQTLAQVDADLARSQELMDQAAADADGVSR
jgi:hypothetical protein